MGFLENVDDDGKIFNFFSLELNLALAESSAHDLLASHSNNDGVSCSTPRSRSRFEFCKQGEYSFFTTHFLIDIHLIPRWPPF